MNRARAGAALLLALLAPAPARAWGDNAHRLITAKAIETLPPELRPFFEANRQRIVQGSTQPVVNPAEQRHRYIYLDRYGRFPFDALPRDYRAAVRKHTQRTIDANGVLPWQIGVYSERLTEAFRARDWDEALRLAAALAHFVAAAHDPFNTTENLDGRLSGQPGANVRFSLFFFIRPNDAAHISDPTDHAFEMCLGSHSWLENILLADRRARRGLPDYTDDYYDRFFNQAGAILIRELSDAASDVGSYWLTAWNNAGRPQPPGR
jgi:hypothetical protein